MRRLAAVLLVLTFAGLAVVDFARAQSGLIQWYELARGLDSLYADTTVVMTKMVPDDSAGAYLGEAALPFSHIWGDTLHGVFTGWADSAHYATLAESAAVAAYADSASNCYHATFADSAALCGSATQADSAIVAWYADSSAAAYLADSSAVSGHSDTADSSGDAASADLCVVAVQATDSSWIDDDLTVSGTLLLTGSQVQVFGVQSMTTPSGLGSAYLNNRQAWYPAAANAWVTGSTDITNLLPRSCTITTLYVYGSLADNGDSCYAYIGRAKASDGNAADTRQVSDKFSGAVAYYGEIARITQDCVVTAGDSLTLLYPCLYAGGTATHARVSAIRIDYTAAVLP